MKEVKNKLTYSDTNEIKELVTDINRELEFLLFELGRMGRDNEKEITTRLVNAKKEIDKSKEHLQAVYTQLKS